MKRSELNTIQEGKDYLREHFKKGVKCPCCDQMVKLYRRKLNSGMAYGLIKAFVLGGYKDFIHVPTVFTQNGINTSNSEFSKLKYWGLVEEQINEDTKKRNSGFWRITEKGMNFIRRSIGVPKYVYLFDGRAIKPEGEDDTVWIDECLGDKFDFQELMKNI